MTKENIPSEAHFTLQAERKGKTEAEGPGDASWGLELDEKGSASTGGTSLLSGKSGSTGNDCGDRMDTDLRNNRLLMFAPPTPPNGLHGTGNAGFFLDGLGRPPWFGDRQLVDGVQPRLSEVPWNSPRHTERGSDMVEGESRGQSPAGLDNSNQDILFWRQRVGYLEEQLRHRDAKIAAQYAKEEQVLGEKREVERALAHLRLTYEEQQRAMTDFTKMAHAYRQELLNENLRLILEAQEAQRDRETFVGGLSQILASFGLLPMTNDAYAMVHAFKLMVQRLMTEINLLKRRERQEFDMEREALDGPEMERYRGEDTAAALSRDISLRRGISAAVAGDRSPDARHSLGPIVETTPAPSPAPFSGSRVINLLNPAPHVEEMSLLGGATPPRDHTPSLLNEPNVDRGSPAGMHQSQNHSRQEQQQQQQQPRSDPAANPDTTEEVDAAVAASWRPPIERPATSPRYEPKLDKIEESPIAAASRRTPSGGSQAFASPIYAENDGVGMEEADDDDRHYQHEDADYDDGRDLPAIEGLRIVGEAFVGRVVTACGITKAGSLCYFEWIRHQKDGTSVPLEEHQAHYRITADDLDCSLEVICTPEDDVTGHDRPPRKGHPVQAVLDNGTPVGLDDNMVHHLMDRQSGGLAVFECDCDWDHWNGNTSNRRVTLVLRQNGYCLKQNQSEIFTEEYSNLMTVTIPAGHATVMAIYTNANHAIYLELNDCEERDLAVLVMREFCQQHCSRQGTQVIETRSFFNRLRRIVGRK